MTHNRLNWRCTLGRWLLAASASGLGGCLEFSLQPPAPECLEPCHCVPQCARSHVYLFIVHGVDPLDCANLAGMRDYAQSLGFIKTYYGQMYHTGYFMKELRRLRCEDPDARFVLIGFSCGSGGVRSLANTAKAEGIPIDLLIYLSATCLKNTPHDRPENVCRVVNILTDGCIARGTAVEGAENVRVNGVGHYASPTHHYTLETLARELTAVAATVPVPPVKLPPLSPEEVPPTPRPLNAPEEEERDEWDFLKSVPRLGDRMPPAEKEPGDGPDKAAPGNRTQRER